MSGEATRGTCEACAFFDQFAIVGQYHICRRRPPVPNGMSGMGGIQRADWPIVDRNDWCGEFETRVRVPKT